MTEREKFEAWLKPQFNNEIDFEVLIRKCGARYANNTTEFQWDAWQARAAQDEWISVDDGLPEFDKRVLVIDSSGEIFTACAWDMGCENIEVAWSSSPANWAYENLSDITHWKPLPEGPKE